MAEMTYGHGGKLYRKVEREAKAGDYVIIEKLSSEDERYSVGDILRAERVGDDGDIVITAMARIGNSDGLIYREEYEVLEEVGEVERAPVTEFRGIEALNEEVSSLRQDLRTFAEESTETAHELKKIGEDVALMDERLDGVYDALYEGERKDFTPAQRLQLAIDSEMDADTLRALYDGMIVAIVEHSEGLDAIAPEKLTEVRELVAVYREYTKSKSEGVE